MRKGITMTCLLALVPIVAPAGEPRPFSGHGYVFYGPGWIQDGGSIQQLGAGGEAFVYRGISAGVEGGYLYPSAGFTYGVGLLSANGGFHLNRSRRARFTPFVTAGYSLAFRSGHESLFNFGGGLTWWASPRLGMRVEFRDYVLPHGRICHAPQFRVALAFR